jgi:hypothetical protein
MTIQFDRTVQLDVYADNQKLTLVKPEPGEDEDPAEMTFDVSASSDKEPNRAKIIVYNLGESTRELLSAAHQGVELYAGYDGETTLIFRGETTNVTHDHQKPLWITTIYAGDGDKEYNNSIFEKSYSAGTQVSVIISDMASEMNIPGEIIPVNPFTVLLESENYSGRTRDQLDKITAAHDLTWSIQEGILEILPKGVPSLSNPTAVLLSTDTGMIGSPMLIERQDSDENTKKKKGKEKEDRIIGVRVTAQLNPQIKPNRLIQIVPQLTTTALGKLMEVKQPNTTGEGTWLVDRVRYFGDNTIGPFDVEAEADILRQELPV